MSTPATPTSPATPTPPAAPAGSASAAPGTGLPITRDVLAGRRRSLVSWAVAVAAVAALYTGFYPAMGTGGADIQTYIDNLPDALVEAMGMDVMTTAGGYLESTVFGLLGPALLLVFAIGLGGRLIAGQEEDGTLELELTAPVSRRSILGQRLLALVTAVVLLAAVLAAVSYALVLALALDVAPSRLLATATALALLCIAAGTIALAVGAATGRRAAGLGAASTVVVLGYMANAIGPLLDADWLTVVSPWSWYLGDKPLVNGWDPAGCGLLALLAAVAAVAGAIAFERRDLGT